MPITGDYTWSETNDKVEVLIPLKGVSPKKVDVFSASNILKVAFPPFLIDLNLFAEIEVDQCRAVLKDGTLKILLAKKAGGVWGQLCFKGTKEEVKQRRNDALREREQRVQQQMQEVATKKVEEERMVFQQHMEIERKEQQRMDDIKAQEKQEAEDSMHKTFSDIKKNECGSQNDNHDCFDESNEAEDVVVNLPPPRATTHSTFRHTSRLFKTPARESTVKQEQEFIVKNRASLKKNKLLNIDKLDLQSKGDQFKSRGDYGSAINAYSDALEADPSMIDVMANRSACFLELRRDLECIKDCLSILDMMKNTADTRGIELEIRVRLGMAYFLTKQHDKALLEFEAAQEIDQNNDTILDCLNYAKVHSEASARKDEADKLFSCLDFAGAAAEYTKALEVDPLLIAALMNRSACNLAIKQYVSCIADSTTALESLSRGKKKGTTLASLIFPDSSTKRKWTVTLLCRRSAAKRLLKEDLKSSLEDLELAMQHAQRGGDIDSNTIEQEIAVIRKQLSNNS